MKFNPFPWLLILTILGLSWWARNHFVEAQEVAIFCQEGGQGFPCKLRELVEKIFIQSGIGYFVLLLGLVSTVTRSGLVGLLAGIVGVASLILHGGNHAALDSAALGFLLGVLTLAREQFDEYRA